jgi:glycosyltransferase involved in cell wall biosynthesis
VAAVRALFVSEDHGRQIMGPASFDAALVLGLAARDDVDARFLRIGRGGLGGRLATRAVPLLHEADLDFQQLRWFVAHALRTRRLVAAELAQHPADVVHVNTHALTLGTPPVPASTPLLLSADATAWDWRAMSRTVPVRGYSERLYGICRRLERHALLRARTVFAYTDWARERLQAAAPAADVRRLRPGVDLEYYRPAARPARERRRVLFVGSRFAEKGGHDLLSALEHRLGRDVELDVVTAEQPPPRPGLRVHELDRGDPVLLELLQSADVFCLPTYADTMSFATMEAMACGTVPVVSALAGIPEVVGAAGETVPPGDVRRLRAALDALLDDPGRAHELGRRARARAETEFDARRQSSLLLDAVHEAA